jgi:hypothetical protein
MPNQTVIDYLNSIKWEYADKDENAFNELKRRIVQTGHSRRLITYSQLVNGIIFNFPNMLNYQIHVWDWSGLDRHIIGDYLARISKETYIESGFFATAIVVDNSEDHQPGWQFFEWVGKMGFIDTNDNNSILTFWIENVNKAYTWYR